MLKVLRKNLHFWVEFRKKLLIRTQKLNKTDQKKIIINNRENKKLYKKKKINHNI